MAIRARSFIHTLGGLWGGDGDHEVGGRFLDMFNHPQHGVAAANVALSISPLIGTPAAAPAIVQSLLKRPEVVNIPGVVATLEAIETAAVAVPFNEANFDAAVSTLANALNAATPTVAADTVRTVTPTWGNWGRRVVDHVRTAVPHRR